MMQVYEEGSLTLQKIRTGKKQTFLVQHVQVSEGGTAVMAANMKSGAGGCNDREGVGGKDGGYTP